jgi:hypothetical protein
LLNEKKVFKIQNFSFFYFFISISLCFVSYVILENNEGILSNTTSNFFAYAENLNNNHSLSRDSHNIPYNLKYDIEKIDDFTLLIYIIGSNLEDESYEATKDINEMLKGHLSNPRVNVVLETGGSKGKPDGIRTIDFSTVKRHTISNNTIHTLPYESDSVNMGENKTLNMGENKTLSDFIEWGISNYPAKRYGLILWDHGGSYGGYGRDINHKDDALTLFELDDALRSINTQSLPNISDSKIDFEFVGFDSCLMSSLEVAFTIHRGTNDPTKDNKINLKYLISSAELEPNWGWNYTSLLSDLSSNPSISGETLGEQIALSYARDSKIISRQEKFFADRDITLSVLDMKKIPDLIQKMDLLLVDLNEQLKNPDSVLKFLSLVDVTEHFGRSATESFGIVDLHHLLKNIAQGFPNLSERANIIIKTIHQIVVYNYKGESHPNSNGISYYLPVTIQEYKSGIGSSDTLFSSMMWSSWIQGYSNIYVTNEYAPILVSERNGTLLNVKLDGMFKDIYNEIYINNKSSVYSQQIPFSTKSNNFIFKPGKVLGLCNEGNEGSCIPVTMTMQATNDTKKFLVPVLIQPTNGSGIKTTLVYELQNNQFFFLGGIEDNEIRKGQGDTRGGNALTIGKEKISLKENDIIYSQGLNPPKYSVSIDKSFSEKFRNRFNVFNKDYFLTVNDPSRVVPKFIDINQSATQLIACDYSSLCSKSKVYNFNKSDSFISGNKKAPSHFIIDKQQENYSHIYVNHEYDFQLEYPDKWIPITSEFDKQNISDIHTFDVVVTKLISLDGINSSSIFPKTRILIEVQDAINSESIKKMFDYFNSSDFMTSVDDAAIVNSSYGIINGYPGFEILASNDASTFKIRGIEMNKRIYIMHSMVWKENSSSASLLSTINDIYNSFKPDQFKNIDLSTTEHKITNESKQLSQAEKIREEYVFQSTTWEPYENQVYNFSLLYPSFLDDIYNQESPNDGVFFLPFVEIVMKKNPYIRIETPAAEPGALAMLPSIKKQPDYDTMIKNNPLLNSDPIKADLWLMEGFYNDKAFIDNLDYNFVPLSSNLTGMITEYIYYEPVFSSMVYGKSLSFIKNGDYIRIYLVAPENYEFSEIIFDRVISTLQLR